jgi:hypothetical protein
MKAKVLIRVERDAALDAIRTLDALGTALKQRDPRWPKQLRRRYEKTRHDLVRATGWWAEFNALTDSGLSD